MEPSSAIVTLTATVAGSSVATLVAQISEAPGGVVTVTSAGATVSAVGALVYVARAMVTGALVARNSAQVEQRLAEVVATQAEVIKDASVREDRFYRLVAEGRLPNGPE